jgi:hypothetical protein
VWKETISPPLCARCGSKAFGLACRIRTRNRVACNPLPNYSARCNVAPTQPVLSVRFDIETKKNDVPELIEGRGCGARLRFRNDGRAVKSPVRATSRPLVR